MPSAELSSGPAQRLMSVPEHTSEAAELAAAKGKVIFVGAGPGNPDLLTVRAREVLERNSVAVVDPGVSAGVRDVVGSVLEVPAEKLSLIHI